MSNAVKVKDLHYERYTIEEGEKLFKKFEEAYLKAECADDVLKAREDYIKPLFINYQTASSLSYCRYTLNTADEFYSGEVEYYDEKSPFFVGLFNKYSEMMLSSPYRKGLEEKLNPCIFKSYEVALKAHCEDIIPEEQEENSIVTEYSKLMAALTCDFDGQKLPISVVRGYLESEDREIRKCAADSIGNGLKAHKAELDDIYDRLVHVRDRMAKKMGYKDYVELGYYKRGRTDYDREMVEKFRANVVKDIVPAVKKLKERVKKELSLDEIMFYDNDVYEKGGTPGREISVEELFENAQKMYDEMNPEIGDFMRSMQDSEAFDVIARENKWGGGYCTSFDKFEQIFILANFNGSSGDVDVITHEFGHAFAMSRVYKEGDWELGIGGMETAECHSMSMEFLSWPWMELFFKDKADSYRYKHLADSLSFIPYGCIVDEFQHIVYSRPDMTPEERDEAYLNLEKKYRPYLSFEGIPYLEEGTRWQYQMHIYESPFYYIDYCLAQTVALGFLAASRKDYKLALDKYIKFAKAGGSKPFSGLVKDAGIAYPFGDGTLSEISEAVEKISEKLS